MTTVDWYGTVKYEVDESDDTNDTGRTTGETMVVGRVTVTVKVTGVNSTHVKYPWVVGTAFWHAHPAGGRVKTATTELEMVDGRFFDWTATKVETMYTTLFDGSEVTDVAGTTTTLVQWFGMVTDGGK
jgi:hypothetical protein